MLEREGGCYDISQVQWGRTSSDRHACPAKRQWGSVLEELLIGKREPRQTILSNLRYDRITLET
jgi:hypothetical protein